MGARPEGDDAAVLVYFEFVIVREVGDEKMMFFRGDVPQLKRMASPPKVNAICFPERNLGGGAVRYQLSSDHSSF
jgi:hypothetical protein